MERIYLEDVEPGRTWALGEARPTEEEIVAFARAFDPQPFHADAAAAESGPFGGLVASGWHTCAMFMRLLVDGLVSRMVSYGSPGVDELRWLRPVRPGDRLSARVEALEARPSSSRPDRGSVRCRMEMLDAEGRPVMQMTAVLIVGRRPPAGT